MQTSHLHCSDGSSAIDLIYGNVSKGFEVIQHLKTLLPTDFLEYIM